MATQNSTPSEPETAAILAGLRLLQATCQVPAGINAILTADGAFPPLSLDQIDDLCERINAGEFSA